LKLSALLRSMDDFGAGATRIEPQGVPETRELTLEADPEITSIHYRAQEVQPGGLFVAIKGLTADGHDYVEAAIARGAAAIVVQAAIEVPSGVLTLVAADTRKALASLAAGFYGHPSRAMTVIGITGTNGKTTTSYLIERILQKAGFSTGVAGTINCRYAGEQFPSPVTTPESLDLQRLLARMHAAKVTHVVLEVSSHALDLHRVDGCWFDIGVFTNLTQDHLDYHKDMDSYWDCKKRLFTELLPGGPKKDFAAAVINRQDPKGRELENITPVRKIFVGTTGDNDLFMADPVCSLSGISGRMATGGKMLEFHSPLVGAHNCENILCAAGVGVALGISLSTICDGVAALASIPGRLEPVSNDQGRYVYVDYAHTPDALENVISAVKELAVGRMICVFGCGGDRDRGKRPLMGAIAARLCDLAVVTSDNPRSEDPLQIIAQILEGARSVCELEYEVKQLADGFSRKGYVVEPDRGKAIRLAVAACRPGDTLLIAGKGHEDYQILADRTIAFDDRQVARKMLQEIRCDASN
jgi:UDP-N-acetylmuramyl-tripeptide synthetase